MNKKSCFAAIVFLFAVSSFGSSAQTLVQTPAQAKELQQVIATTINDTVRIDAMNDLAEYYGRILG